MSIATRTGDSGTTGLMYHRRVSKQHPRIEACGAVDELNSFLGVARAANPAEFVRKHLLETQQALITLMGELGLEPEDLTRYRQDGYPGITRDDTAKLDRLVADLEIQKIPVKGWAIPGENAAAATLDVARTVCRRAERRVAALKDAGALANPELLIYLNRLSDALWLLARWSEQPGP